MGRIMARARKALAFFVEDREVHPGETRRASPHIINLPDPPPETGVGEAIVHLEQNINRLPSARRSIFSQDLKSVTDVVKGTGNTELEHTCPANHLVPPSSYSRYVTFDWPA